MDKLTFYLSVDEINIILAGLGELPAKTSLGVIKTLQEQAAGQGTTKAVDGSTEE